MVDAEVEQSKMAHEHSSDLTPRGLTPQKAAQYVGISLNAFMALVGEGRLPAPVLIGSHALWDRHAIDRYFDIAGDKTPDLEAWQGMLEVVFPELIAQGRQEAAATKPFRPKRYSSWTEMPEGPARDRRRAREDARERAEIRKSPLGKWEKVALWELYRRRDQWLDANVMAGVTFRTHGALKARGYVSTRNDEHGNVQYWQINQKGIEAVQDIPEEPSPKYRKR